MSQDDQPQLIPFFSSYQMTSSPFQYPNIPYHTSLQTEEAFCDHHRHHHMPQKVHDDNLHFPTEGSSETLLDLQKGDGITATNKKIGSDDDDDCGQSNRAAAKWMSSKMRLMRKMMNSYPSQQVQPQAAGSESSSSICSTTVRVCSDCNTTKTPLWRSGPQGPKSLCNACGIRQRKARKAMAASAGANMNGDIRKIKKVSTSGACKDAVTPYKKRYKLGETRKKIDHRDHELEDFGSISLKENKTGNFHPLQDEKEAAILLMALSCGLIYG